MATNEEIRAKDILPHKTSFGPGDGFYGDGPQSFFMEAEKLLELTAQNALAGNLAPAFDPTRDAEHPYLVGEVVIEGGELYKCTVEHSGVWNSSHFEKVDLYSDIINGKVLKAHYTATSGTQPNFRFVPALETFGLYFEKNSYSGSSLGVYAYDSSGNNPIVFLTYIDFGETKIVSMPEGYDTIIVYNDTASTVPIDIDAYVINMSSINVRLTACEEFKASNEQSLLPAYTQLSTYSRSEGQSINWKTKFHSEVDYTIRVEISSGSFPIAYLLAYACDSSGTNATLFLKSVVFGADTTISIPSGYDELLLYNGTAVTENCSFVLYRANTTSYNYKLELLSRSQNDIAGKVSPYLDEPDTLYKTYTKVSEGRLQWQVAVPSPEFTIKITQDNYVYSVVGLFAIDSNNVLPQLEMSSIRTDVEITIIMPAGYDTLLIFNPEYIEPVVNIELYLVNKNSLRYQVEHVDKLSRETFTVAPILSFGDSITEFTTNLWGYCKWLEYYSGVHVVNGGIGGTRYHPRLQTSMIDEPTNSGESYNNLDMYNLVDAWINNSWTAVDAAVEWLRTNGNPDYRNIITRLKNTPIDSVGTVTLFAGTNDFTGGTADADILSAITHIIDAILTAKPSMKIFVFSPTVRWINYENGAPVDGYSDNYVIGGRTLKELSATIINHVKDMHIPICDLYNTMGWNMKSFSAYFNPNDGTHPRKGFDALARRMYGFIRSHSH